MPKPASGQSLASPRGRGDDGPPHGSRGLSKRREYLGELPDSASPALFLELVAAMLDSGSPLPRALGIAAQVSGLAEHAVGRAAAALEIGVPWDKAWAGDARDPTATEIQQALHFAATTGAPSAQLISARARLLRRSRHRELERRAAALGVRLVLPLGTCSLPAFLCLGVVPVLMSMAPR